MDAEILWDFFRPSWIKKASFWNMAPVLGVAQKPRGTLLHFTPGILGHGARRVGVGVGEPSKQYIPFMISTCDLLQPFRCWDRKIPCKLHRYRDCGCSGSLCRQGINNHDMDLVWRYVCLNWNLISPTFDVSRNSVRFKTFYISWKIQHDKDLTLWLGIDVLGSKCVWHNLRNTRLLWAMCKKWLWTFGQEIVTTNLHRI